LARSGATVTPDYELAIHVSVNEVPPPLRIPGDIIVTLLLSLHSTAITVLEVMLPVPVVLEVTDMFVYVTNPKSASEPSEQLPVHTPGFSVITSALTAAGAELVITVENVQPAVVSTIFSVH
jgi:hypothetical protein